MGKSRRNTQKSKTNNDNSNEHSKLPNMNMKHAETQTPNDMCNAEIQTIDNIVTPNLRKFGSPAMHYLAVHRLKTFSTALPEMIHNLSSIHLNDENTEFYKNYVELQKRIKRELTLLTNNFTNFVAEDYNNLYQDYKIMSLKMQSPSVTDLINNKSNSEVSIQTDLDISKADIPKQTQTDIVDMLEKTTLTDFDSIPAHSHDNNNQNSNVPNNVSKLENVNNNYSKLMIQDVPQNFNVNLILQSMKEECNIDEADISIHKKWKSKFSDHINIVIKLPSHMAEMYLKRKCIKFNSFSFRIKQFIDIIRCHKCQRLGHVIRYCNNTVVCAVCSKAHADKHCFRTPQCFNCMNSNKTNGTKFNINHTTYSENCNFINYYIQHQIAPKS